MSFDASVRQLAFPFYMTAICLVRLLELLRYNFMKYTQIILIAILLTGCNAEKRAAKKEARKSDKALKYIQKAERVQPNELAKWCAKRYNPIDSVRERTDSTTIIYQQSEPIYVFADCDSAIKAAKSLHDGAIDKKSLQVRVKCPPCDSAKIISVFSSRFQQASNKAALDSLDAHYKRLLASKDKELAGKDDEIKDRDETISEKDKDIAKLRERIRIALISLTILAAYTLLRWILRIWGVKLP